MVGVIMSVNYALSFTVCVSLMLVLFFFVFTFVFPFIPFSILVCFSFTASLYISLFSSLFHRRHFSCQGLAALGLALAGLSGTAVANTPTNTPVQKNSGGISVGATRVIYNEADNGATVRVINTSTTPFLIQTWVESYKGIGAEKTPELQQGTFITTPPLYRQDKGENSVRIVRARGDFPRDRESVLWLNIKSIASSDKPAPDTNYVQFAFNTRIKMFYRPTGLKGKPSDAYQTLTFTRRGNQLTAINPTAYNVTLNSLKVNGVTIEDADKRMVPPLGSQSWSLPAAAEGSTVTYVSLNDFGGLTPPRTVTAQ